MKIFINLVLLLFVSVSVAQIDTKKSTPLKLKLDNPFEQTPADNSNLPSLEYKSVFDSPKKSRYSILSNDKETPKSILDTSTDFKNPGDEVMDKLNKEINKEGNWDDVFFGKYVVRTSTIKIKTRDFMDPDGDRIRIFLNYQILFLNELLGSNYETYVVNLREGENAIDIMALNQGLAGPNTANFAIYDENDNLITTNDWNLKTGVSAKFIIDYKKPLDK